ALTPTQTISGSVARRSASPLCRIQWHRDVASPPSTSRASASRTPGPRRSRIAARRQQDVSLPNPGDPALFADAGQSGELEDAYRFPAEVALVSDEAPGRGWGAPGVAVLRCRDAKGTGLVDRLAQ